MGRRLEKLKDYQHLRSKMPTQMQEPIPRSKQVRRLSGHGRAVRQRAETPLSEPAAGQAQRFTLVVVSRMIIKIINF